MTTNYFEICFLQTYPLVFGETQVCKYVSKYKMNNHPVGNFPENK